MFRVRGIFLQPVLTKLLPTGPECERVRALPPHPEDSGRETPGIVPAQLELHERYRHEQCEYIVLWFGLVQCVCVASIDMNNVSTSFFGSAWFSVCVWPV